ncbi:HAD family hydrolase [Desulforhopalus vacuolatus]|uniref:Cof-type HAD-IIB family hydrolase n=1 Tax=Desulforhopalus vacuolatus TaxID=40414 RepID=UPI001962F1FD|nr:Cof-type HAD-IIB family hydrolase [Desulforhopalus vacuolatus]MBM9519364.1 HAD family hydrolase [Desulforhopalus vacuolatus]
MTTLKVFAVDMDGTFLDDHKQYDKPRFLRQLATMRQQGIHFVAASGNRLATLHRYLPEVKKEIGFVAENGGYVLDGEKILLTAGMSQEQLAPIFALLPRFPRIITVACCRDEAFCLSSLSETTLNALHPYYVSPARIAAFTEIKEPILKLAIWIPPQDRENLITTLTLPARGKSLRLVDSGNCFTDLLRNDVSKAAGLRHLLQHWQVRDGEVASFGDNSNDVEMLRMTPFSFAPVNAKESAKKAARIIIGNNNDNAVQNTIDYILIGNPL